MSEKILRCSCGKCFCDSSFADICDSSNASGSNGSCSLSGRLAMGCGGSFERTRGLSLALNRGGCGLLRNKDGGECGGGLLDNWKTKDTTTKIHTANKEMSTVRMLHLGGNNEPSEDDELWKRVDRRGVLCSMV
eukprot:285197_1